MSTVVAAWYLGLSEQKLMLLQGHQEPEYSMLKLVWEEHREIQMVVLSMAWHHFYIAATFEQVGLTIAVL